MNQLEKVDHRQLWLARISDLYESKMTQQEWCNKKKIPISTLRYWLRIMKKQIEKEKTDCWLKVDNAEYESSNFSVMEKSKPEINTINIKYGDFTIQIPNIYEPQRVFDLLRLLKSL